MSINTKFNESFSKLDAERPCPKCKGTGAYDHTWIWDPIKKDGHFGLGPCEDCQQTGKVVKPDFDQIFERVTKGKKGETKRTFRASKPKLENEFKNRNEARIYYVWRIARFHGGVDVTMPVMAGMANRHDPYSHELDLFAEALAKLAFGTDMAAAWRWGTALGMLDASKQPDNLPASAYPCGPVADAHKPEEEQPELL